MHTVSCRVCICLTLLTWISTLPQLHAQGTQADYARAAQLAAKTRDKVTKAAVNPHWLPGGQRFWYRNLLGQGAHEFVFVDAQTKERRPAFDHARLAATLSKQLQKEFTADRLPFEAVDWDESLTKVRFVVERKRWECSLTTYELQEAGAAADITSAALLSLDEPRPSRRTGAETSLRFVNRTKGTVSLFWIDNDGERKAYGKIEPEQEHDQHTFAGHVWLVASAEGNTLGIYEAQVAPSRAIVDGTRRPNRNSRRAGPRGRAQAQADSPDGKWSVLVKEHNAVLRDRQSGDDVVLTQDGQPNDAYTQTTFWSPDSRRLIVMKTAAGDERQVQIVESSPRDQLQPKLHSFPYLKPGDRIPVSIPHLFDVVERKEIPVAQELFPTPWSIDDVRWLPDSSEFRFTYNQRGHQLLRVIGVDAQTGRARTIIDEQQPTFVDYAHKQFRYDADESGEIIWMSERDGWNHLYLYDARTGTVKNQITRGDCVVRGVDRVDPERREIWFRASGLDRAQDPYFVHECRIPWDGTNLVRLTTGDGTHTIAYSPDRTYYVDNYSRVDLPPVSELRRTADGALVCELERGDWSALRAIGWQPPEPFVAKGRDDKTDIWGVIFRPTNFDSNKKYPVIEQIYAGPQSAFVPKKFQPYFNHQSMAELGFIVVQIDGMGTSHRSKAFHDVCHKNLGDSGFPDRIRWLQAAAAKYPQMDLTRVGIYGGSAGGQSALRALLAHPDAYHVAVADCGCHDNRMDKTWWNELWMGWPVGPHYAEQSNVTNAHKLQGKLLLTVGELDRNVDPASTMQVVNALIKADKDFEFLIVPGGGHGVGEAPYAARRRQDFFVRHLLHVEPRRAAAP